jgi:hypothetical protein
LARTASWRASEQFCIRLLFFSAWDFTIKRTGNGAWIADRRTVRILRRRTFSSPGALTAVFRRLFDLSLFYQDARPGITKWSVSMANRDYRGGQEDAGTRFANPCFIRTTGFSS